MADLARCSFCGKSATAVEKLAAGTGVYICNECVDLCRDVLKEDASMPREQPRSLPDSKPLRRTSQRPPMYCSFCGRAHFAVRKIVAGPGARICNDCLRACDQTMRTSAEPILHPSFPPAADPT